MKKIIALILVTVLAVCALASCNNNKPKDPEVTTPKAQGSEPSVPSGSNNDPTASTPYESTPIIPDVEFETRDEDVYVFGTESGLKLRTSNFFDNDTNVAEIVPNGTKLHRIGYSEAESISKVVYEGKEYICGNRFITTEVPGSDEAVEFETVDETVYIHTGTEGGTATIYTKAYKGWSSENKKNLVTDMAYPTEGTAVKRTGICYEDDNDPEVGWSRIEYNGVTVYVRNSVLTKTAPTTTPAATTPAAATPATTPAS